MRFSERCVTGFYAATEVMRDGEFHSWEELQEAAHAASGLKSSKASVALLYGAINEGWVILEGKWAPGGDTRRCRLIRTDETPMPLGRRKNSTVSAKTLKMREVLSDGEWHAWREVTDHMKPDGGSQDRIDMGKRISKAVARGEVERRGDYDKRTHEDHREVRAHAEAQDMAA